MSYEWLYALRRFGSKLDLERIKEIMEALGYPQDKLKFIHIAGTNGKGSVSRMIQAILTEAKYKVGRYNSPHIIDFRERISIDDKWIPEQDLLRIIELIKSKKIELTFFEFVTAIALQYFHEQKVDYVVWETGLGGRFDATNVVDANVAVITNIDLEHTAELGNTKEKIAFEKSGIIKNNSIVVYGGNRELNHMFNKGKRLVNVDYSKPFRFKLNLKGKHQINNAKVALTAINELDTDINEKIIDRAFRNIDWPGRLEQIDNFILDCAHNPAGMKALKEYIDNLNIDELTIIFGVLKDKDYLKMFQLLPKHSNIIITKPKSERALEPDKIAQYSAKCIVFDSIDRAMEYAKQNNKGKILVTGSCYTVSEAREWLIRNINI